MEMMNDYFFFIFRVKYNTCIVYIYILYVYVFLMTNMMLGMLCYSFQTTDLSEASLALFSIAPARESGKRGCDITSWPHGLGPVSVGVNFVGVL